MRPKTENQLSRRDIHQHLKMTMTSSVPRNALTKAMQTNIRFKPLENSLVTGLTSSPDGTVRLQLHNVPGLDPQQPKVTWKITTPDLLLEEIDQTYYINY